MVKLLISKNRFSFPSKEVVNWNLELYKHNLKHFLISKALLIEI